MGDFAQIPPVIGKPLYKATGDDLVLLSQFNSYNLSKNVRHKDDNTYQDLIRRMRMSELTPADLSFLTMNSTKTRDASNVLDEKLLSAVGKNNFFIGIFNTNRDRHLWNTINYNRLQTTEFVCIAVSTQITQFHSKPKTITQEANLEKLLKLKKGCRVILLKNSDTNSKLTNGSLGTVIGFQLSKSFPVTNIDPEAIAVKFDDIKDPIWIKRLLQNGKSQFPLQLGYGITAHKVQCKTFNRGEKIFIDCHNLDDAQRYVAFSRVAKFSQLTISNFSQNSSKSDVRARQSFWESLNQLRIKCSSTAILLWNLTDENTQARFCSSNPKRAVTVGKSRQLVNHNNIILEKVYIQFPDDFEPAKVGNSKGQVKLNSKHLTVGVVCKYSRSSLIFETCDIVLHITKLKSPRIAMHVYSQKGQAIRLFPWDPNVFVLYLSHFT
jgi:hypothetical protein